MKMETVKDMEGVLKALEKYSILFLLVAGVFYLLVTYSVVKERLTSYEVTRKAVSLLNVITPVIKSLEKERGMSAGYLKGAEEFAEKLKKQRKKTDEAIANLKSYLKEHPVDDFGRQATFSVNNFFTYFVNNLPDVRREVDSRSIGLLQELSYYTKMIDSLISVAYSLAPKSGVLSNEFIAYGALVTAQDAVGLERALGSVVFAEKKISLPTYKELVKERTQETSFVEQFDAIAPSKVVDKFNLVKGDVAFLKASEIVNDLVSEVKVVSDNGTVYFTSPVIDKYTPSEWWDLATKKVDDFVDVSRFMLNTIDAISEKVAKDAIVSAVEHVGVFFLIMGYVFFMVRQLSSIVTFLEKKY